MKQILAGKTTVSNKGDTSFTGIAHNNTGSLDNRANPQRKVKLGIHNINYRTFVNHKQASSFPSAPKDQSGANEAAGKSFDLNSLNSAEQEGQIQKPQVVSQKLHVR
jgi:hypothetical protein